MTLHLLLLLKRQILIKFSRVCDFLQLVGIPLHLLFQILDTLGYALGNLEIVLYFLHRWANLGLLQSILCQCLVSLLKLSDLFLLQIDLGHLPVIIRQLLIVIIIRWLLIILQLINDLFLLLASIILARMLVHGCLFLVHGLLSVRSGRVVTNLTQVHIWLWLL